METSSARITRFFLQSLQILKKESGSQRWNAICDDTVDLAIALGPKYFRSFQIEKDELWQLLFHPPQTIQESTILHFFFLQENTPMFLLILLQALTDPPKSWWQALYNDSF